jgi:hypothetical protein
LQHDCRRQGRSRTHRRHQGRPPSRSARRSRGEEEAMKQGRRQRGARAKAPVLRCGYRRARGRRCRCCGAAPRPTPLWRWWRRTRWRPQERCRLSRAGPRLGGGCVVRERSAGGGSRRRRVVSCRAGARPRRAATRGRRQGGTAAPATMRPRGEERSAEHGRMADGTANAAARSPSPRNFANHPIGVEAGKDLNRSSIGRTKLFPSRIERLLG